MPPCWLAGSTARSVRSINGVCRQSAFAAAVPCAENPPWKPLVVGAGSATIAVKEWETSRLPGAVCMESVVIDRRRFSQLAAAAFGGLLAGSQAAPAGAQQAGQPQAKKSAAERSAHLPRFEHLQRQGQEQKQRLRGAGSSAPRLGPTLAISATIVVARVVAVAALAKTRAAPRAPAPSAVIRRPGRKLANAFEES